MHRAQERKLKVILKLRPDFLSIHVFLEDPILRRVEKVRFNITLFVLIQYLLELSPSCTKMLLCNKELNN